MNTDKIYAERIASEYASKETSKVNALRKLDAKAKRPSNIFAYVFGIVFTLVLGVGMCLSMGVLGDGSKGTFALGIALGVVGIAGMCVNYPIYRKLLKKGKNKYGADIIELARKISDND